MNDLVPIRNALNGGGVFDGAHGVFFGRKKGQRGQSKGIKLSPLPLPARRNATELGLGALGNGLKDRLMSKDTMVRLRGLTASGHRRKI
jgi:hypothetical protein